MLMCGLPGQYNYPLPKRTLQEFRWDKGDLRSYYAHTGALLSKLDHKFSCFSNDHVCNSTDCRLNLDIYYNEIVHCLMPASRAHIPRIPCSALKHYWSSTLDDLKQDCMLAHNVWQSAGRPRSGYSL